MTNCAVASTPSCSVFVASESARKNNRTTRVLFSARRILVDLDICTGGGGLFDHMSTDREQRINAA